MSEKLRLQWQDGAWQGRFNAMASPCEVLIALPKAQQALAQRLVSIAAQEVWRIEQRYSRYRSDNLFTALHNHPDQAQRVDAETARLLNFADQAWRLSDGRFDLSSGLLRQVWSFDGSDRLPEPEAVTALLSRIGWHRVDWHSDPADAQGNINGGWLTLPAGMELDFGGIGKEYAADRALGLCLQALPGRWQAVGVLVNLGGDLACNGPRPGQIPWRVGIEAPDREGQSSMLLKLSKGGLATSGDSRRFLQRHGRRYSHLLDPKTGWPVENAPRSVTVAAPSCIQSGLVASLAMLAGSGAREFLAQTGLPYWMVDA